MYLWYCRAHAHTHTHTLTHSLNYSLTHSLRHACTHTLTLSCSLPLAAVVYWICGVPLSMYLWYRRIYNAARDDSTISYIGFFLFFLINVGFCIWAAIGERSGHFTAHSDKTRAHSLCLT